MPCLRRCLLSLLALVALCAAAVGGVAYFAADWLVRADAPARADAIVVLSGDVLRTVHAAELYALGLAPQVIVTVEVRGEEKQKLDTLGVPFPRTEALYRDVLVKLGVPATAIRLVGRELVSTAAEADALAGAVAPGTRLLIVTSPYHTRRARMIFTTRFPEKDIRVVATPHSRFPSRWWTDQDAARNVVLEFAKIAFHVAGGRF